MNFKLRNTLAEIVSIGGICQAALPGLTAASHLPAWVGPLLALIVTVANQLIKDGEKTPPPTPPSTS